MTNELEKQFFDTFGIEPKPLFSTRNGYTDDKYIYPTITDSILLELICINNKNTRCIQELIVPRNLKLLKKSTLRRLIENSKISFQIKHQVRTLFEEG